MYALIDCLHHRLHHRFYQIHRHLRIWLILSIVVGFLTIAIHPVQAQQSSFSGNQVDGYPVVLDDNVLFRIRQGIPGVASAEERANIINGRLTSIANDDAISPKTIRVEEQDNASVVFAGDTVLFTVRESDRIGNQSRQATAANSVQIMQSAVTQYRHDRSIEKIVRGILFAVLSTVALLAFLVFLQRFISRLLIKIRAARRADALDLRIQSFQLLGSNATGYLLSGLVRILRLILILVSFYLYIPFILSQFPATRSIARSIFDDIAFRINQLATTFVQYLPNLATIAIIAVITYYIIQFAKLVITELGRDNRLYRK